MGNTEHGKHAGHDAHHSSKVGYETTDFSWPLVLSFLPVGVIVLVGFTLICIFGFRGYKDSEMLAKQATFETPEINELRAKENEVLSRFKILDSEKGTVQIPIERAIELFVKENQNSSGAAFHSMTDVYLQGAPFDAKSNPAMFKGEATSASSQEEIKVVPTPTH